MARGPERRSDAGDADAAEPAERREPTFASDWRAADAGHAYFEELLGRDPADPRRATDEIAYKRGSDRETVRRAPAPDRLRYPGLVSAAFNRALGLRRKAVLTFLGVLGVYAGAGAAFFAWNYFLSLA